MYAGRLDYQVKIQGYRIELGEIEYHVREFLKGQNAVVVDTKSRNGDTELVLCIEGSPTDTKMLMGYLKSKIPPYMLPTKIQFRDSLPLNSNSKVDRKKIKELMSELV